MMTSSNGNIFRVTGPLCGEFTGPGEFPAQRPVTRSFDVFFDLRPNKRLSKQPWGWWFETSSSSSWSQRNGPRTSSGDLTPGDRIDARVNDTVQEKRPWLNVYIALKERQGRLLRARRHRLPTMMPSVWKNMLSGWQSLRRRKSNSEYLRVIVFRVSSKRWTEQTWTSFVRIVYEWCWWACALWRRQDGGMGWTLCKTVQCRVWMVKRWAPQ